MTALVRLICDWPDWYEGWHRVAVHPTADGRARDLHACRRCAENVGRIRHLEPVRP